MNSKNNNINNYDNQPINMETFYSLIKKDFLYYNMNIKNNNNNNDNNNKELISTTDKYENSNNNNNTNIDSFLFLLPNEIVSNILQVLTVKDIVSLMLANSYFYSLINGYNNLWKNLYFKYFKSNYINSISNNNNNSNNNSKGNKNNYNNINLNNNSTDINKIIMNEKQKQKQQNNNYNNDNNNNTKLKHYKNWKNKFITSTMVEHNWENENYSTYSLDTNIGGVFCLSQKKSMLVTGSFDSSLKLWKIKDGDEKCIGDDDYHHKPNIAIEPILNIKAHDGWIWSSHLKNSKNYHKMKCISSSQDGTILISEFDYDQFNSYKPTTTGKNDSISIKSIKKQSQQPSSPTSKSSNKKQVSTEYVSRQSPSSNSIGNSLNNSGNNIKESNILIDGSFLVGHKGTVWSTLSDKSMSYLYSGSSDNTIKKWDISRMEYVNDVGKHNESVLCLSGVSYEHPNLLASGSSDHTIKLWDIRIPQQLILAINEHGVNVDCLSLTNSHYIVSGGDDGKIRICDIRYVVTSPRPSVIAEIKAHEGSIRALSVKRNRLITSSSDMTVKIWDTQTIQPKQTLLGHRGAVISMQLNNNMIISGSLDSTLKCWSFK